MSKLAQFIGTIGFSVALATFLVFFIKDALFISSVEYQGTLYDNLIGPKIISIAAIVGLMIAAIKMWMPHKFSYSINKKPSWFWSLTGIVSAVLIAVIAFIYILYRSEKGKKNLNMFLSNFALTKSIMKKITAYRFSSAMSLLLNSGMNVDNSIDILLDIAEEPVFKENIKLCKDSMKSGDSFLDSINKLSLFSSMHMQMLHMGEKIGEMDVVMNKLTDIYENEAEQAISNTVSLIEPVLVGILSVLTGVILISVMLPLMNIMSSIG